MYGQPAMRVASPFRDVESTIRGLTQDFCTSFNTGNYDHAAALFSADGLFMCPYREMIQGPKAIEQALREYGEAGNHDLRCETLRIDHSGELTVEVGRYTISVQESDGTVSLDRGKYVHAWRRLGVWLLTADCWSCDRRA
jgi:ketosteroid isomerase-like protein